MDHSPTLELYRQKLGAMLAEAHRRHIADDRECAAALRLLEQHRAIIDAMTSAERCSLANFEAESAQSHLAARCGMSREDIAAFLTWWDATHPELDEYLTTFAVPRHIPRNTN